MGTAHDRAHRPHPHLAACLFSGGAFGYKAGTYCANGGDATTPGRFLAKCTNTAGEKSNDKPCACASTDPFTVANTAYPTAARTATCRGSAAACGAATR